MVVEDEWLIADQLCATLKDIGYTACSTVSTGQEAIRKAEEDSPDLVLMDIVLKGEMDGIQAANCITSQFDIPVLYLTAYANQEYIDRATQTRPFGYLVKPYNERQLHASIEMALYKHRADKETHDGLDHRAKCFKEAIIALSETIELRGPYAPGHHQRVAEIAHVIAKEMGLADFAEEGLLLAAYIYDISLVNIPVSVSQDSGQLTGLWLTLYKKYPNLSYDILKEIHFPWPIAKIALQHREHYDGSGFPQGIKRADILIEAKILAVAIAFEDLTSQRIFRKAFPLNQALDQIKTYRGSYYDPDVVDACLRLFSER